MKFATLFELIQAEKKPDLDTFISCLSQDFPLLNELKNTPQDPLWHQEGSVYNHTSCVLNAMYELIEKEGTWLNTEEKLTLILSAVFHDIAKPLCTKTRLINDIPRIVSPYHEEKGASYLSYKLLNLPINYAIIQDILRLVAYHHIPKKLVLKHATQGAFYQIARVCKPKLLYLIAKADILGRICEDHAHQLDIVELFKIQMEELQLFHNENPYLNWRIFYDKNYPHLSETSRASLLGYAKKDFEEGLIFTPEEMVSKRYPFLKSFPHLVIMYGPSGSGKSHYIKQHLPHYYLISLDLIRQELFGSSSVQKNNQDVIQVAKERLKQALREKQHIVWDATSLKKDFRSQLFNLGRDYNAFVTLVVLHTPYDILSKQNKNRDYTVDQAVILSQLSTLEWPSEHEVHQTIFIHNRNPYVF